MQGELKKVEQAISHLDYRIRQIKRTLEELLLSLDLQDKVSCQDTINKYSSLAGAFSAIQTALKKSALSVATEDHGQLLKSHLMVPQQVSLMPDLELQNTTEGRVVTCNHEVIPVFLRTKLTLELEEEERKIDQESSSRPPNQTFKQINLLNKHLDSMINRLETISRQPVDRRSDRLAFSMTDTLILVKAISRGIGIQPKSQLLGLSTMPSLQQVSSSSLIARLK